MKGFITLLFCAVLLPACSKEHVFKQLPEGPIRHHLIALGKTSNGAKMRGLIGATPPLTHIECTIKNVTTKTTSDTDGSFSLDLSHEDKDIDEESASVIFTVNGTTYKQNYTVKNLGEALSLIAQKPFKTDKEIDDLAFYKNQAFVLASQGGLVQIFDLDPKWRFTYPKKSAFLLNQDLDQGSGPRSISILGDALLSSFFNSHEVAAINIEQGSLMQKSRVLDVFGQLKLFDVIPSLAVNDPIDADGMTISAVIKKTAARNTEAIMAIDKEHFLVSFVNYFQFFNPSSGRDSVVGPGIIALMKLENQKLTTIQSKLLPCKNPSQFIKKDDHTIYVLCTGEYHFKGDNLESHDAAIARVDLALNYNDFTASLHVALPKFSPAPMALVKNKFIIPHAWHNEILVLDETKMNFDPSDVKTPSFNRHFQFTFAQHFYDDYVFLGDHQGSLVAYSTKEGFFPFPFVEPIGLYKNADKKLALGPLKLYFRHAIEGYDLKTSVKSGFTGILTTAVHKIVPLDFLAVFGP